MSTNEQESRFGDAQLDASSAKPGDVVYRDGNQAALIVSVNEAEGTDDVAVTVFPLTGASTVHANDLATRNVDDSPPDTSGATPTGIPSTGAPPSGAIAAPVVAATQPGADDPGRATTPTGAPVGGGSAAPVPGAAQPTDAPLTGNRSAFEAQAEEADWRAADATMEESQDARIARLEAELAAARGTDVAGTQQAAADAAVAGDTRADGDTGAGPSGSAPSAG
jgi:hypothetical protein